MESEGASSVGAIVGGVEPDQNETGSHEREASSPNSDGGHTIGFSKILEVDLVMEELLQYLSVKELKVLSSVSKDALIVVRKSRSFSKRVQFRICEDSIRSRVLDNCFHSWKAVKFGIYHFHETLVDYIPAYSTISRSLDSVNSLWVDLDDFPEDMKESLRCKVNDFFREIIKLSKETLEDLRLYLLLDSLRGIEFIKCPKLKRLTLFVPESTDDELVEAYLKNLPPLECLDVQGINPSNLIRGLQGRMFKLHELEIGIGTESGASVDLDLEPPPRTVDWNVLKDMTKLEDISITVYTNYSEPPIPEIEEMLGNTPVETVTTISIKNSSIIEVCFSQKLGEHISRFNNLTTLTLECLHDFDDSSLQGIIKGCPKLKNLTLDGLPEVTDFGVSGFKSSRTADGIRFALEEQGVSPLDDLRDLVSLAIRWCGPITLATLLRVIRFEFLTSLKLGVFPPDLQTQTPRMFLIQLLQQNPNLNQIDIEISQSGHFFRLPRDFSLEDEVKAIYSRILQIELAHDFQPIREHNEEGSDGSDDNFSDSD